jgi:hypothetical protein
VRKGTAGPRPNPWIVRNRYEGKAELSRQAGDALEPLPYPVTTMLLIAEKLR